MLDCVIIGAGPAGLTAGLYAGRYRMSAVILEKLSPGGQIMLSPDIQNFPGFPGGIATPDLIERMKQQVEDVGVRIEEGEVNAVRIVPQANQPLFTVHYSGRDTQARTVIIATGATWKHLGVPGEEKFIGRGVSYCGTCDGPLFRNKDIVVVGGGDHALEDALYLTKYAASVRLVHRRQGFRAAKILEEKVRNDPKITLVLDSVIEEILGGDKVESVKIRNVKSGEVTTQQCQGVFIFVGISPAAGFVKDIVKTDDAGFIITGDDMQTSVPGIYAAGDCRRKALYQVINGCGDGAVAAHAA
ncbi:MAG TPA: thioredoxin-disulfide reductase, partial [Candidatus Omnitrophota bacterium]|nr:thioredoxin-disulfide reductase [Candidatus Omnitrophota bacterium]